MTNGPFLYDEGPEPLHTSTPRRRPWFVFLLLGGSVLAALVMVVVMLVVRGTPSEQGREVTEVFLAALQQDDLETAHGLLCQAERAQLAPEDVAALYDRGGEGRVAGVTGDEVDGTPVQRVAVEWPDGSNSVITVIAEDGIRICGIAD